MMASKNPVPASPKAKARQKILVRYGELWLKSEQVRKKFLGCLADNMRKMLRSEGLEFGLQKTRNRLFVETAKKDSGKAMAALKRVFGLGSVSLVSETSSSMEDIEKLVLAEAKRALKKGKTFAVRAKRAGNHDFTSQGLERDLGAAIVGKFGNPVSLKNPDVTVGVEVRDSKAYVFTERTQCAGGLPLGIEGTVLSLFDGSAESVVATWLVMKRGCRAVLGVSEKAEGSAKVRKGLAVLGKYDPNISFVKLGAGENPEAAAERVSAKGIVSGRTFKDFAEIAKSSHGMLPLDPLVGMSPEEIKDKYNKIVKSG